VNFGTTYRAFTSWELVQLGTAVDVGNVLQNTESV